jgi:sporulation protein YlmC with PRC-barrel domain
MNRMIRKLLATTAITTIALTSAYAASDKPAAGASTSDRFIPSIGEASLASELIGETVYTSNAENAETIGEVNDLIVGNDGNIDAALIGVGGFLGVGEKNVAVNFEDLNMSLDKDGDRVVVLETTKEELEAAPAFENERADTTAAAPAAPADNRMAAAPEAPADTATAPDNTTAPVASDQVNVPARDTLTSVDVGTISSDNVIGKTLYSADNQDVGDVAEVIMTDDGKIDAVIADVGGFLGIGAKSVALNFSDLDFRADDSGNVYIYTPFTEEQLQQAPEYVAKDFPNARDRMLVKSKN